MSHSSDYGGWGGEEKLAKETEKEQLVRSEKNKGNVVIWKPVSSDNYAQGCCY